MHDKTMIAIRSLRLQHALPVLVATALAVSLLGACGPEDKRAVGGGLGADIGNHAPNVPKSKLFGPTTTSATDAH